MQTRCTPAQCHALLLLAQRGTLRIGQIAKALELDKSTVSRSMQPLVARKLVEPGPPEEDRRRLPVRLTAAGRELVDRINRRADAQVGAALDTLSPLEAETVARGMELYARGLARSQRTKGLTYRRIEPADDPAMANVIQQVMTEFGAVGAGYSIEDAEVHAMSQAYQGDRSAYFVVIQEDRLLGGAGIAQLEGEQGHVCELKKMYILPQGRGLGVGRALLEMCLEAARDAGFSVCYLETLEHMTQARNLYEKAGFAKIDGPMGNTGHTGCNSWYTRSLVEAAGA